MKSKKKFTTALKYYYKKKERKNTNIVFWFGLHFGYIFVCLSGKRIKQ